MLLSIASTQSNPSYRQFTAGCDSYLKGGFDTHMSEPGSFLCVKWIKKMLKWASKRPVAIHLCRDDTHLKAAILRKDLSHFDQSFFFLLQFARVWMSDTDLLTAAEAVSGPANTKSQSQYYHAGM